MLSDKVSVASGPFGDRSTHGHQPQSREVTSAAVADGFVLRRDVRRAQTGEDFMEAVLCRVRQHGAFAVQKHLRHAVGIGDVHIRRFRVSSYYLGQ